MRKGHWLRANKGLEAPTHWLFFDTETDPVSSGDGVVTNILRFGWAAFVRRRGPGKWSRPIWYRFDTLAGFTEIIDGLCLNKVTIYALCHNTSFDLAVLDIFSTLPAVGWVLRSAIIQAPPTILKFARGKTKLCIFDSLNHFRVPLAVLGERLGLPKLTMPARDAGDALWDQYCRRDVAVLMETYKRWVELLAEEDLGGFALTLASQALRTYTHRFMPTKILIEDHEASLKLARASYLGGRCEVFRMGRTEGPVYVLDVNSMYPSIMQHNNYPSRKIGYTAAHGARALTRYLSTHLVVARVEVVVDEPYIPHVIDGRLCFPTGRFMATLCTPELVLLLESDSIRSVGEVAVYDAEPLFTEFVEYIWGKRMKAQSEGQLFGSWLYKIIGNSLYGKFGQTGKVWEECSVNGPTNEGCWRELDLETGTVTRYRTLAGLTQRLLEEPESRNSSPAIAAHVTSYARVKLWSLINMAGRENVIYTDTDSLWCTQAGYDRLEHLVNPEKLGGLKLEHVHSWADIKGAKDYATPDGAKCKGVSRNAVWTAPDTLQQTQWRSLRGALAAGELGKQQLRVTTRVLSRCYSKGVVGFDGVVTPIFLEGEGPAGGGPTGPS